MSASETAREPRKSFERWLESHTEEPARAISARSLLRCLPALASAQTDDHVLSGFRATLTILVILQMGEDLREALETLHKDTAKAAEAYNPDRRADLKGGTTAHTLNASAVYLTLLGCGNAAKSFLSDSSKQRRSYIQTTATRQFQCANQLGRSDALNKIPYVNRKTKAQRDQVDEIMWKSIREAYESALEDTRLYDRGSMDLVYSTPLFTGQSENHWTTTNWVKLRERRLISIAGGHFWREWYQGMLDGQPMDWELQKRIALIPNEDWKKGAAHIARLIEEIRARFELEKRIAELEGELAVASRGRLGIGGNNPPEPIEGAPSISREFTVIWEPIQDLKEETQSEAPDKSRIRAAIARLSGVLKTCGLYAAKKADTAIDKAVGAVGLAGGTALVAWLTGHGDKITRVIEAAEAWLKTF